MKIKFKQYVRPSLKRLDLIAISEISLGKGHRYLTVVLNLKTGAVIFVGEDKGADALAPFFSRLKGSKVKVKKHLLHWVAKAESTKIPIWF